MTKGYTNDETFCTQTGFYWFCDQHDTHGNADSAQEAYVMADAHWEYFNGEIDDPDAEICDMIVTEVGVGVVPRPA